MSALTAVPAPRSPRLRPSAPRPTRPVPTAPAGMRLTRRGRVALVAVIAALAFLAIAVGQAAVGAFEATAGSGAPSSDAARTWVVQPGETLWSIAQRVAPGSDPRDTVARIVAMNDLSDSSVVAGQQIFVPA